MPRYNIQNIENIELEFILCVILILKIYLNKFYLLIFINRRQLALLLMRKLLYVYIYKYLKCILIACLFTLKNGITVNLLNIEA